MIQKYSFNQRFILLFFLVIFATLHTLRNLSSLYLIVLFFLIILNIFITFYNKVTILSDVIGFKFKFFLIISFYVAISSPIHILSLNPLIQIPRLLIMPILAYIILQSKFTLYDFSKLIKWFVVLVALGSVSLLYQVFMGHSIYWFNVEESSRGGMMRYGTILGSLTIYGTIVGVAILFTLENKINFFKYKTIVILILVIGAIISLQKAAILNILIALFVFLFKQKKIKYFIKWFFYSLIFLLIFISFLYLNPDNKISNYFVTTISQVIGSNIFDAQVTIVDSGGALSENSFTDRLYGFAFNEMFEVYDPIKTFFLGNGMIGAGGAMGLDGPQSHNSYWDLFFMGGILYLFSFLALFFEIQKQLYLKLNYTFGSLFFWSNWIFLINGFGSSISMFHPVLSFPFWLSMIYAYKTYLNKFILY